VISDLLQLWVIERTETRNNVTKGSEIGTEVVTKQTLKYSKKGLLKTTVTEEKKEVKVFFAGIQVRSEDIKDLIGKPDSDSTRALQYPIQCSQDKSLWYFEGTGDDGKKYLMAAKSEELTRMK